MTAFGLLLYVDVRLRILIVSPHYWPEPFRVTDLASGLRQRGHEVEVLTDLPNYPAGRFYQGYGILGPYREQHEGILVNRVPVVPRGAGGAVRLVLNYLSFALAGALRVLTLGRCWDVAFVFQTSPVTALLPATVLRALYRVPVAVWVQDLWPESISAAGFGRSRVLYAVAKALSGWLYRRCDRVLGTSRAFQQRLGRLGVELTRFDYLPQWAEPFFDAPPVDDDGARAQAPSPGAFPVMFAGNLGRAQALETLLDAADLLREESNVRWVFVGDGSRRAWLEEEVARRGLHDKVALLGRRPAREMPRLYGTAGALIVSLRRDEAMSLTIPAKVQACLAAGRPIVGSIDGETARVIEDSGAGWVAPAGDAVALADVVRRMKELPAAERESMGARGRAYSAEHFSRDRCLDQLERALRETVAAGVRSAESS